jgi:outer membrane protein OmpA-like peptidoglycan-associated protein/tetratricopeptide (TPR) repeat protein
MKKIYTLSLMFCLAMVFGQTKLKKADEFYKTFAYVDAAKAYEEYLQKVDKPGTQTIKNAADSYYYTGDSRNALKWYQKLYDIQGQDMTDDYFLKYIQSMKGVMDYEKADVLTKEYLTRKGDQKQIAHFINQKKQMDSLAKTKPLYEVRNLDNNSSKSDFGTAFYGEKVVYASSKDTTNYKDKLYSWNKQPFLNLYVAERNTTDGSLFNDTLFLENLMTRYHEATITFSPDWKTAYYTTNIVSKNKPVLDKDRTNNLQIIKGTIENGKLTASDKVFFSSPKYSVGHPSLSEDGKWLFFASDMPDGLGGTDLYVLRIADDGTMGTPQNLGPKINTAGNELFPYFRNGILYFSSDGHYGWGDLDVYESKFSDGLNFSEPKNLGAPINSNRDDFSYIIDAKETYGYVSSNRAGGKGDDDIYYFTKGKPICNEYITGKVTGIKSKLPIQGATVNAYNEFGDLITSTTTDANGYYKLTVPCGKKIKTVATKINYSTEEKEVVTQDKNDFEIPDIDFELSNYDDLVAKDKEGEEKIIINPIFFEFDKWNIGKQAAEELDKVVFVLQKFPNVKIKIESHTDSRGKDAYNMKLSDNRAKSTQTYILSKGVDPTRIESAIGYGESRLTNKCTNGVKCTEDEQLANRRSNFIVIQK